MDFYKVLYQNNQRIGLINSLFDEYNYEYLQGNCLNSIAVRYSPNTYFDFISDDNILSEFQKRCVKQLFVTNQNFIGISKHEAAFHLKVENCVFDDVESDEIFSDYFEEHEDAVISYDILDDVLKEHDLQIKEMTFRTMESRRKIIIQKNGVLGVDNNLSEQESINVKKIIDTLNIGLRVLNDEKTCY